MVLQSATIGVMLVRAQDCHPDAGSRHAEPGAFRREVFDGVCVLIGGALLALPASLPTCSGRSACASGTSASPQIPSITASTLRPLRDLAGGAAAGAALGAQRSVIDGEYESVDAAAPEEGTKSPNDDPQRAHSPWRRADAGIVPSKET